MTALVFRDVEVDGVRVDVRVAGGRVTHVAPGLLSRGRVIRGHGHALIIGLVDHHIHLHALAARTSSTYCGPPDVTGPHQLTAALAAAPADEHGWVRGVGYDIGVAGDLDADALDRLHAARPVRLAHHSGALWVLNRCGAALVDLAGADHPGVERDERGLPTGRVWRADAWLRSRLPPVPPPDLLPTGRWLAARGITAVTDATPDLDETALRGLAALPQRVQALGVALRQEPGDHLAAGPFKIVLADSDLPDLPTLVDTVLQVHDAGRAVAAHCVTREALVLMLTALDVAGRRRGDRIEHAALVPDELVPALSGLHVITQPAFLADRGDRYRREVPEGEHDELYRVATLCAAGVPTALSSDAPHGPADPWAVLAAAAHRQTRSGQVLGAAERVTPRMALRMLQTPLDDPGGPAPSIRPGAVADLVLLGTSLDRALTIATENPAAVPVRATLVGGELLHDVA
jgi:predicted amidohydrolase YtcJ